ncbi:hypothetical protein ES703_89555 [subsurface metagenome]
MGVQAIVRHVTERKQMETELRKAFPAMYRPREQCGNNP